MGRQAIRVLAGAVLLVGLLITGEQAVAQTPPIASIEPSSFSDQPAAIRYGGLLYQASLKSGFIWDSNLFLSQNDRVSDRIAYVRPGLTVSTLDPNYKFTFRGEIDRLEYDRNEAENRSDFRGEVNGTIRVRRDTEIDVSTFAGHIHELRSALRRDLPDDIGEPVPINRYIGRVALRQYFYPLISTTFVSFENDNYFNVRSNTGGIINLQASDADVWTVGHEAEFRLSPRLSFFSRQRVINSDFRDVGVTNPRDSTRFETVNGIEVALTRLISTNLAFRYGKEDFVTDVFRADPERAYLAGLTWSPRRYLRFRTSFAREFGGFSFEQDIGGGRRTRATFDAEYDISRRLLFRGGVAYLHGNEASVIAGGQRIEDSYAYRASLSFQLNRYWSLYSDYMFEQRNSTLDLDSYDRHIIQGGVIARF